MLVGLLNSKLNLRKVIVTDRDTALMNVVAPVLPKTKHVLCYFHIEKNVKAKCITNFRIKANQPNAKVVDKEVKEANDEKHCDIVKKIVTIWREVVESPMEDAFENAWLKFKEVCEPFLMFLKYVELTVLLVKEQFMRAWTDKILHLGCRSTNIV